MTQVIQLEDGLKPQAAGNEAPTVGDRFCCCSIFVWAKVFAVLSAIVTVLKLGDAVVGGSISNTNVAVVIVMALVSCSFVALLLINAFYWHRSIAYAVYAVFQILKMVAILLYFVSTVSVHCVDQLQCVGSLLGLAILCAWEILTIYVFVKAAQCQKRNEGYDMK